MKLPPPYIQLVYKKNEPIFKYHGFNRRIEYGKHIYIEFGVIHAGIDDISYPAIHFSIETKKEQTGWKAFLVGPIYWLKNGPEFLYLKPQVLELMKSINDALRQQKEIDLWEFQKQYTDQFGDAFRMDVSNNSAKGYFTLDGFVKNWFEFHPHKQGNEG